MRCCADLGELGFGVDALNDVADVLTVAVFATNTFDTLFGGMADHNDESVYMQKIVR